MKKGRRKRRPRGRAGGRAGGAGYDFQDVYVARQLARLLVDTGGDSPIEVLWEKKDIEWEPGEGVESVFVDDVVVRFRSGKTIYTQVKETSPSGRWTVRELARSKIASDFWRQWNARAAEERSKTVLRLASVSDVSNLRHVVDVAQRARTPAELLGADASAETVEDIKALSTALGIQSTSPELLSFLKSLDGEQLPPADDLERWVSIELTACGAEAAALARHLIRLVAKSKHVGSTARSAYSKDSLASELRAEEVPDHVLLSIGALETPCVTDETVWDEYRAQVVKQHRTLPVYGLEDDRPLFVDLAMLYVALKLAPLTTDHTAGNSNKAPRTDTRSITERLRDEARLEDSEDPGESRNDSISLAEVLQKNRRVALVGGPGSGKTLTLRWLALISALPNDEGRALRLKCGLSSEPLVPVYVRFRQLADHAWERGFESVNWRAELVVDFLAAQLETSLVVSSQSRQQAVAFARGLLDSERAIFLLDGLDEVTDQAIRNRLLDAVSDLITTSEKPRFVSSWRPYALQRDLSALDLALFEPLPFDRSDRAAFAHQWYEAVRSASPRMREQNAIAERTDDLAKAAESLRDLAQNPLLYSILALVHFHGGNVPLQRAALYDRATLAMLGHWDRDKRGRNLGAEAGPADLGQPLDEDLLRPLVEDLAHHVQCTESAVEFQTGTATEVIEEGLQRVLDTAEPAKPDQSTVLVNYLVERSGLLQERRPGVLAFSHLSFQEYLAARWFVGRDEVATDDLAFLAKDEGQSEVVRFAIAILGRRKGTRSRHAARALVEQVASENSLLAAASLVETPDMEMSSRVATQLARDLWYDSTDPRRHHSIHPRVFRKLFWRVLADVEKPDQILLEVLASGESEGRHPMESELGLELLAFRPPSPLSEELAWFLRRLASLEKRREHYPAGDLASLITVEAGASSAADHLPALVRLLSWQDWRRGRQREAPAPSKRAEELIGEVLLDEQTRGASLSSLRTCLVDTQTRGRSSRHVARMMLSFGEPLTDTIVDVLIEGYLYYPDEHEHGLAALEEVSQTPHSRAAIEAGAKRGLTNEDRDVRLGCFRLLRERAVPWSSQLSAVEDERETVSRYEDLLEDPKTAAEALEMLGDKLWEEDDELSWQAARALIDSGNEDVPGLTHALVNAGLCSGDRRPVANADLQRLRSDSSLGLAVRASLLAGLRSESGAVATGSAILLLAAKDIASETRMISIVRAALKDPTQLRDAMPYLEELLGDTSSRTATQSALGQYFEAKNANAETTSVLAIKLAELGYLDAPSLAQGLVFGALSDALQHGRAVVLLRRMLDDPSLVTEVRRALARGLESEDRAIAWGAARCLWKAGSRADPKLPSALVRVGLSGETTKEDARAWLLELLAHSRTAENVRTALERECETYRYQDESKKDHDLAWEIACCFRLGKLFHPEYFPMMLVWGGVAREERHAEAIATIKELSESETWLAGQLESELLKALASSNKEIASGAARTLYELRSSGRKQQLPDPILNEQEPKALEIAGRFIRIVLRERERESWAEGFLADLAHQGPETLGRRAVLKLLEGGSVTSAYRAARFQLELKALNEPGLSMAIVSGGLGSPDCFEEAAVALDSLRSEPSTAALASQALNRALWSDSHAAALGAAVYLTDRGEIDNPGVGRGLVFGGFEHGAWRDARARKRLQVLLDEPATRGAAVEALQVAVHQGHPIQRLEQSSLLIRVGEILLYPMLECFAEISQWHAVGPLAVLARTGRAAEVRNAAAQLGLSRLVEIIGDGPCPGES